MTWHCHVLWFYSLQRRESLLLTFKGSLLPQWRFCWTLSTQKQCLSQWRTYRNCSLRRACFSSKVRSGVPAAPWFDPADIADYRHGVAPICTRPTVVTSKWRHDKFLENDQDLPGFEWRVCTYKCYLFPQESKEHVVTFWRVSLIPPTVWVFVILPKLTIALTWCRLPSSFPRSISLRWFSMRSSCCSARQKLKSSLNVMKSRYERWMSWWFVLFGVSSMYCVYTWSNCYG